MKRTAIVAAAATLIVAAGSSCSSSQQKPRLTTGRLSLESCVAHGVAARCGTFVVPEDRGKPHGRTIALRVVVLPATSKPVAADAVTYLAGGPGDAATEDAAGLRAQLPMVNAHHDILLVDQRGTGSTAYTCPDRAEPLRSADELRRSTRACLEAFGGDMNQLGTRAAMDDLDAVRGALGYRQLDVIGGSYGGTAAQVYLRLHPASVRTLVLEASTAIDVPIFGRWARNAQRALDQVTDICDAQPACRVAFPDWERRLGRLIRAWNARPVRLGDGRRMTGDELAGVVHVMLLDLQKAVWIPLMVSHAARGDLARLEQQGPGDLEPPQPQLMTWSIWCNEPWTGLDAKGPWGTRFDSYTTAKLARFHRSCAFVPKRSEPSSLWTLPSSSRVPVLAIAGGADPQDPPGNVAGLERRFRDSRTITLPHVGHQFGIGGCVDQTIADFLARGTTRGLDTTRCDGAVLVPPFPLTG